MKYTYKVEGELKGEVKLDLPSYEQSLALYKSFNLSAKNKEVEVAENSVDMIASVLEVVKKHVIEVKVSVEKLGIEIESVDDLGHFMEGRQLINDLGKILINGLQLGNG